MEKNSLLFEAENVNDEGWDMIIETLRDNLPGFEVLYGDGNYMEFKWDKEFNRLSEAKDIVKEWAGKADNSDVYITMMKLCRLFDISIGWYYDE